MKKRTCWFPSKKGDIRLYMLLLLMVCLSACSPTIWGKYKTHPPQLNMATEAPDRNLQTLLMEEAKNKNINAFNDQRLRSFQKQSQKKISLACVQEGTWVIEPYKGEFSKAGARPLPVIGSDQGLKIKETIKFVITKVDEINDLFKDLTQLRRLLAEKPDDVTFSSLAISI